MCHIFFSHMPHILKEFFKKQSLSIPSKSMSKNERCLEEMFMLHLEYKNSQSIAKISILLPVKITSHFELLT